MQILNNVFYMYSNMNKSSQILLFLIILVVLMLLCIFVINLITKKKDNMYNLNSIDKYIKSGEKEKISKKDDIKVVVKEEKPEEDIEVIEVVSDDNSIDKISELLEDNMNNLNPIDLTKFEEEQEKNAIISYDELVKRAGSKKIVYKTNKTTISEEKPEKKIQIKESEEKGKFKASQIISPIYGIQKQNIKQNDELEEFIDLEEISIPNNSETNDEMIRDMDFLSSLKTFRSNLD